MTKVLDDFCSTHGIVDYEERMSLARNVVDLFAKGVVSEPGLRTGLAEVARTGT